ncbi:hypothetical protein P389DRAFT_22740 [Cystobasidium minutum MCA 4210]|uniref:uncharacterized protein n=1 Tax=Cystobasidium minutum MCA 4210 TaxID=1397322 RepID=UPI0034CE16DA|eukprot:jgi/Rhomi1/22740/CE22739_184
MLHLWFSALAILAKSDPSAVCAASLTTASYLKWPRLQFKMHINLLSRTARIIEGRNNARNVRVQEENTCMNELCQCLNPLELARGHLANKHLRPVAACLQDCGLQPNSL